MAPCCMVGENWLLVGTLKYPSFLMHSPGFSACCFFAVDACFFATATDQKKKTFELRPLYYQQ